MRTLDKIILVLFIFISIASAINTLAIISLSKKPIQQPIVNRELKGDYLFEPFFNKVMEKVNGS
jgi:hypothetical protein